mgnify:FL=1
MSMKEAITIYKLIVLYTLNRIESPLTLGFVADYVIDHGYTNYINVQNAFAELLDAELIACSQTYNTSYYTITEAGRETLELFYTNLSHEIRAEIDQYLREKNYQIIDRTAIVSDYTRRSNGDYVASCMLVEKNEVLFQVDIAVPSEEDAVKICNNWRGSSSELYSTVVTSLLK